jgi:hypothetical protein
MKAEVDAYFEKHIKAQWDRRNKFYMSDHWYDTTLQDYQAPIVVNHCRKAHHWYLSLLTDTPAKLSVYGYGADDYTKEQRGADEMGQPILGYSPVERVNKLAQQKWDERQIDNKYATALSNALIYSVGWLKPCIDKSKTWIDPTTGKTVIGDLNVHSIDPWFVRVDPTASWSANPIEVIENAEYVYHGHFKSLRRLRQDYPKAADKIDALAGAKKDDFAPWQFRTVDPTTSRGEEAQWLPEANAAGSSANTGGSWVKAEPRGGDYYDGRRAFVWEMWMREGGPDYPNGVVLTIADETLLDVRANPYEHGHFPFIPIVVNPIPGRLYGFGIFDIIIPVQQALNKRHGQLFDMMNWVKGLPLTYEEGSFDPDKLVMEPGVKIPYRPGSQPPQWMQFPQIPAEAFRSIDGYKREIEELLGLSETVMAGSMKAGTAGVAIEGMIDQAMQRIRMTDRWNHASRTELGYQMLSIMQQLYRYTGYELRLMGEQGSPESIFLKPDDIMGKKDFKIITAAAETLKKEAQFKKAMDMRAAAPIEQAGIPIPDPDVIELSGLPNPEGLKKEVEMNKGLQQQIQQLQQENEMLQQELQQVAPEPEMGQPGGPM